MTRSWNGFGKDLSILSFCWAMVTTSNMLLVSVSALTGYMLAEDKALGTLPVATQWVGTALTTVPASFLMARLGRRAGFAIAAVIVMCGAGLAVLAIDTGSFPLYCLATALVGGANGFTWYYRFAAAEVAPEAFKSRAISLVLAGGVFAALAGPTLADHAKDMLAPLPYAGAFAALTGLQLVILVLLAIVRIPRPSTAALRGGRPIGEIARQPKFLIAVFAAVVSYGVMVLLMSISPLAMKLYGHDFAAATKIIQWHVLGMYVPAFFSGHMVRRYGTSPMMLTGAVLMLASVLIGVAGTGMIHFWVAMTILGVGWNFLYVSATNLLTETYTVAERAKTQAANEFSVFVFIGLATYLSGTLLHHFGWRVVNLAALPLVLIVLVSAFWLIVRRPRPAP